MGRNILSRILLADDEPDILEISRIALETVGGFSVEVCSSGDALLRRLPEFKPDLVIIDFLMPDMAGVELLRAVRLVPGDDENLLRLDRAVFGDQDYAVLARVLA